MVDCQRQGGHCAPFPDLAALQAAPMAAAVAQAARRVEGAALGALQAVQ